MFIKFNYKTQKRKINTKINTMDELKSKAREIYGDQVVYCDYMYQDEDNELVALVDDMDLETCYEEAEDNGLNRINVFIEISSPKTKNARSMSKKRKVIENDKIEKEIEQIKKFSSDSESEESTEEIYLENKDEVISSSSEEEKVQKQIKIESEAKRLEKIAKIEAKVNEKKMKIQEKIDEKIRKLQDQKKIQLNNISNTNEVSSDEDRNNSTDIPADKPWMKHIPKHHRRRMMGLKNDNAPHHPHHDHHPHHVHHPHHGNHPHHGHHHHKHGEREGCKARGPFGFLFKAVKHIKDQIHQNPDVKQANEEIKEVLHDIKKILKPLKDHPKMLLETLKKVAGPIKAEINKALEEVKNEHPHFKQHFEAKIARADSKLSGRSQSKNTGRRETKRAAMVDNSEKMIKRQQKEAIKEQKIHEKQALLEQKRKMREEKKNMKIQALKNKVEQKAEVKDRNSEEFKKKQELRKAEIQQRVDMIFPIFSNKMDKAALRQEVKVEFRAGLSVQDTIKRILNNSSKVSTQNVAQ